MGSPRPCGAQTLTCKVNGNHRILYINGRVKRSSVSQIVVSVCPVRARRHSSLRHTAAQKRIKRPCLMLTACVLSIGYTSITNLPKKKKNPCLLKCSQFTNLHEEYMNVHYSHLSTVSLKFFKI